jgi:HEAT repeat protein
LIQSQDEYSRDQYYFNLDDNTISGLVATAQTGRIMLCTLARYLHDPTTANLLEEIAARHSSERVRATAYESLAEIHKNLAEQIWRKAIQDKHPLVRRTAAKYFEQQ